MKTNYEYHSRFLFTDRDKIQDAINQEIINENDIVICSDTKEFVYVSENFDLFTINSRVYRYTSLDQALNELNTNSDTYAGQIVAILNSLGHYQGYIVNQDKNGEFFIETLSSAASELDYNNLGHKPITNLTGIIGDPIILDTQENGIYKVTGTYKISEYLNTTFSSFNNTLFIVSHGDEGYTYVKKIGTDITCYIVDSNGNVTSSSVVTTKWLEEQGYTTKEYVDEKIATLDFLYRSEVEDYVQNIVTQIINQTFTAVTQEEALEVFTDIFEN